jgi:T5SS/PEP-CTERM-associated repeat protein
MVRFFWASGAAALALGGPPPRALATNYVWTNLNGSNVFNEPRNWNPLAPPGPLTTNDAAIFDGTQPGSDTFTVTFTAPVLNDRMQVSLPGVLSFNLAGQTYTLDGGLGFETMTVGQTSPGFSGLLITNGSVNAVDGGIGSAAGNQGGLQVVAGGAVSFSRLLRVGGSSGTGSLSIRDGGTVASAGGVFVASGATSSSNIDVVGTGSALRSDASLQLGNGGNGRLQVFTGGLVDVKDVDLGLNAASSGTLVLDGTGSQLRGTTVIVGLFGKGDATVQGGAHVDHTSYLEIGEDAPGSLLVTGAGSSWTAGVSGVFSTNVGSSSTGTLTVDQGGAFTAATNFNIGLRLESTGRVLLAGANSRITAGNLYVGGSLFGPAGDGTLSVAGGTLTVNGGGVLRVHRTGTLDFTGGTINTPFLDLAGGRFDWSGGTLNVGTLATFGAGSTGTGTTIGPGRTLTVGGTTVIEPGVTLTLDGGAFSTQSLQRDGALVLNSGKFTTASPLTLGTGQPFGTSLRVGPGLNVTVNNTARVDAGSVLSLAGGSFTSGSAINNFGEIQLADDFSNLGGGALNNNGLVTGSGRVSSGLTNNSTGVVRAGQGQRLSFRGTNNTTAGAIDLVGGTVEFTNALTNLPTGEVHGRGTLVTGGLTNQGAVFLSSGITDVFGSVTNATGGRVVVSGNADATFWDNVTNNGAQFKVADGSSATFFGTFSGQGISGTGKVYFEGTVSPGNSPGLLAAEGDVTLGGDSVTRIELAGRKPGLEFDRLDVGGRLAVAGTLQVTLLGGFEPESGDAFDLFDAGSMGGQFRSVSLPALGAGLAWDTRALPVDGSISVVPEPPAAALLAGCAALLLARRRRAAA